MEGKPSEVVVFIQAEEYDEKPDMELEENSVKQSKNTLCKTPFYLKSTMEEKIDKTQVNMEHDILINASNGTIVNESIENIEYLPEENVHKNITKTIHEDDKYTLNCNENILENVCKKSEKGQTKNGTKAVVTKHSCIDKNANKYKFKATKFEFSTPPTSKVKKSTDNRNRSISYNFENNHKVRKKPIHPKHPMDTNRAIIPMSDEESIDSDIVQHTINKIATDENADIGTSQSSVKNKIENWKVQDSIENFSILSSAPNLYSSSRETVNVDIAPGDSASAANVNFSTVEGGTRRVVNYLGSDGRKMEYVKPENRASRGIQSETKEEVFQQALSLMTERCVSRPNSMMMNAPINKNAIAIGVHAREGMQTPLVSNKEHAFGVQSSEYFLVHQQKPSPMPPIPAWKGYNGNVYFSPIYIQQTQPVIPSSPKVLDMERCSPELQQILLRSRSHSTRNTKTPSVYSATSASNMDDIDNNNDRGVKHSEIWPSGKTKSRPITGSVASIKSHKSTNSSNISKRGCGQLILDKDTVLTSSNDNLEEEYVLLAGQESTGSLQILSPQTPRSPQRINSFHNVSLNDNAVQSQISGRNRNKHSQWKERIHRGSMARRVGRKNRNQPPLLSVNGDKFSEPTSPPPLLRAQTQYSQSNQRGLLPSPENSYHSFTQSFEKLPPLEHLRASLRHINHTPVKSQMTQFISPEQRMKFEDTKDYKKSPFIKFSPELKKGKTHLGFAKDIHSIVIQ